MVTNIDPYPFRRAPIQVNDISGISNHHHENNGGPYDHHCLPKHSYHPNWVLACPCHSFLNPLTYCGWITSHLAPPLRNPGRFRPPTVGFFAHVGQVIFSGGFPVACISDRLINTHAGLAISTAHAKLVFSSPPAPRPRPRAASAGPAPALSHAEAQPPSAGGLDWLDLGGFERVPGSCRG